MVAYTGSWKQVRRAVVGHRRTLRYQVVALAAALRRVRILTCFLEEQAEHIVVHDVLHERAGATWKMRVSSYLKLRLSPTGVVQALHRVGLTAHVELGSRGMVRVVAAPD
jgi:hypothetical protein